MTSPIPIIALDVPTLTDARALVARRPGMAISLLYLAQIERESGNLPAAAEALKQAQAASLAATAQPKCGEACDRSGRATSATRRGRRRPPTRRRPRTRARAGYG